MDEKIVDIFKRDYLFTKEDILKSLDLYMENIEYNDDEDYGYTDAMVKKQIELCNKFKKELKKCKLPILTELWWYYNYSFTGDGVELNLCAADEDSIEINDGDDYIGSMSYIIEHKLLDIKCELVTIEQYAEIQEVSPNTVKQWIKRGRLRNAKKNGEDWLIPSIENKPSREYESVDYLIEDSTSLNIQEFPLVSMCDSIWIYQDKEDKSKFICILMKWESHFRQELILTKKEVEQLEYALISSGKVKTDDKVQFIPHIR